MRLKKIKLAGFKSFVDPTSVEFPHALTGIVGPNGCGKSNIIDAVRWVMGESSAKHLRGHSMEDVIFSGSQARKPVGKAFVELVFDNTVGKKAPGAYAKYSEIAIRREVTRDGRSDYFLNRTRCRKKDITDIFLGTGLGPRAYSIIEQGMVTRVIESKPEELRVFVEEAAGISRYKERRRETENRIRHTRENLSRVDDIRSELESQLARLKRQASAARRFKEYKQEQRRLQGELLALRWQGLSQQLEQEEAELSRRQTELEGQLAKQRESEAAIERLRTQQHDANDAFNQAQGSFYQTGAEVSRLEQSIRHARDTYQERLRERDQLTVELRDARDNLRQDADQEQQLHARLEQSLGELTRITEQNQTLNTALSDAEAAMSDWQQAWEEFSSRAAQPAREKEVQNARIMQIRGHLERLQQRYARLDQERENLQLRISQADSSEARQQLESQLRHCEVISESISALDDQIHQLRKDIEGTGTELNNVKVEQQRVRARLDTLTELQEAALGKHDQSLMEWLQQSSLDDMPRLADAIQVEAGWEQAVDRVLGSELTAVCLQGRPLPLQSLDSLNGHGAAFFEAGAASQEAGSDNLAAFVRVDNVDLSARLAGIFVADDINAALARRDGLAGRDVIVTRDGTLVGRNWISLAGGKEDETGVMARQSEIDTLAGRYESSRGQVEELAARFNVLQKKLADAEVERREKRNEYQRETTQCNEENARLHRLEAELDQARARQAQVENELREIEEQKVADQSELSRSDDRLAAASTEAAAAEQERQRHLEIRQQRQAGLDAARHEARHSDEALHHLQLQRQEWEVTLRSLQERVRRTRQQVQVLEEREQDIEQVLQQGQAPEQSMQQQLDALLERKLAQEERLKQCREQVSTLDQELREKEQLRQQQEAACQTLREALEQERMKRQEQVVRRQTLEEKLQELDLSIEQMLAELPDDADYPQWDQKLADISRKIERLGNVNLMAIDEYEEQSERKAYLDKQHADLSEALATLEGVMGKIDRETRTRFKETFDRINDGFQRFFPELFGGGHAYLELTGDDLLDTGVAVMARPPGKRNSTINLLSGGEKALTAVAMLFSIFELNPAPFCLLDEVDAPLDEANVSRYCNTLNSMSDHTQLIFITHNKVTMEAAGTLIGVTMAEPGVSRLVSVNLQEAEKLAG